ncbi:MAG: tellurite resistance TerB family protein [Rivularia sp. (in: cyanobacteria)]
MRRLFDKLCGITKRYGSNRLIRIGIASLPHHLHDTAFVVAADLVLADGEVTQEEENTLVYLYTQLDISDEKATNIFGGTILKNKE